MPSVHPAVFFSYFIGKFYDLPYEIKTLCGLYTDA